MKTAEAGLQLPGAAAVPLVFLSPAGETALKFTGADYRDTLGVCPPPPPPLTLSDMGPFQAIRPGWGVAVEIPGGSGALSMAGGCPEHQEGGREGGGSEIPSPPFLLPCLPCGCPSVNVAENEW